MKKAAAILITALINNERSRNNLLPVTYNYELDNVLREHNVPDSWYYGPANKTIEWNIENNTRHCSINGCFYEPMEGYSYLARDTYKDSIPKIFRYRLSQRDCEKTDFENGKKCSWKYAYYDVLMQNFTSYACKSLNFQGTWTPTNLLDIQKRSFFCWFDTKPYYWSLH